MLQRSGGVEPEGGITLADVMRVMGKDASADEIELVIKHSRAPFGVGLSLEQKADHGCS
ncbi:hypothetical protein AAJV73_09180 [Cyanobium sp. BSA11S]|uniref:hypothetical protein n=1 Tax=Synechococcales TaxID=1890424 RepID=UPI0016244F50|nr:hypothetical protein [Synechococcus sp. BSF8S]